MANKNLSNPITRNMDKGNISKALKEVSSISIKASKVMTQASEVGKALSQSYLNWSQSLSESLKEAIEVIGKKEIAYKSTYDGDGNDIGLLEAWRGFAQKEGYLLPQNFNEFIWWFLGVKHGDKTASAIPYLPDFTRSDLFEFHEYQKKQLEQKLPENNKADIKIRIKEQYYDQVLNILKIHFDPSQHIALDSLLQNNKPFSTPFLIFNGNAAQLCDFINQLSKAKILTITRPVGLNLINWIVNNFKYINREGKQEPIKSDYAEKFISGSKIPADKNKLIEIKTIKGHPTIVLR